MTVTDSDPGGNAGILDARGISIARGGKKLVESVSISATEGEIVGLIGPNGAGKSTLLRTLAGLNRPDSGLVKLHGKPLHQYAARERARQIGWMEQFAASHWPVRVELLVALGRLPYLSRWQKPTASDQALIDEALQVTDCEHLREQKVTTLSGGELTRVMLARVLATDPSIILADEPVAALDIGHQLQTMDQLSAFTATNRACIVVLHDLSLAARYCHRLYLMHQSRIIAEGVADEVLSKANLRNVYGVEVMKGSGDHPFVVPVSMSQTR